MHALFDCKKATIAAFNGPRSRRRRDLGAADGHQNCLLHSSVRVLCSPDGVLCPKRRAPWFLPQIVGLSQALRWCLSGAVFDAQEALRGGLVSEVVASRAVAGPRP